MLKKIFIGVGIFLLLLVGGLVAFPFLFKDKIIAAVKEEINKNVNAKVNFGDFSISIIKNFPNITFGINDVSVINEKPFKGDTLAYIGNFNISLDIMTVIKGQTYDVKSISINDAKIAAKINKEGKTNWDIAKPTDTTTTESSPFSLKLRKFDIANANIIYKDDSSNVFAQVANLNINANGDFTQDVFVLNSTTSIEKLTYRDGLTAYLKDAVLNLKADVEINQITNKYTFKENELSVNELVLGLDGFVVMNEKDYDLDVKLNTKQTDFKTLLSLVPNIYKKDFANVKTSGKLGLNAFAKGKYSETIYPAFGINLNVNNATFQYPSVPTAVRNIFIDLKVSSPGGNNLDNTLVDLSRFNFTVDNDPFALKAKVSTPISDPNIDAYAKGKLDLKKVPNYYPMEELKTISGILTADVSAKGKLSAIEQERYQDFNASGTIDLKGFRYETTDLPAPLAISNMELTFNPKNVTLNNLNARIGKSDFAANGTLDNLLNYVFADDNLKGTLSVRSNNLDLNEFMTESNTETTTSDTVLDVNVPANIDFVLNGIFNNIQYDKIELKNVSGNIVVRDQTVNISNLQASVFEGSVAANGSYSTKNIGNPEISFDYDLKNIDFQQAFKGLDVMGSYAPILKNVSGKFSSKMNIKGKLGEDLSPDLKTLVGDGLLEVSNIKVSGVETLNKIADKFKLNQLKNLSLEKGWTVFKIKDGRMTVDPTDLKVNDILMNFSGTHGLDNTLDYKVLLDAPTKLMQGAMGEVNNLVSQAKIPGLTNAALPEALKLKIDVTGNMDNPQLKFGVVGAGGSSLKDSAKELFDQKKKELEDKAKAELEAQKLKAQQEFNKQKEQAEAKAKVEVDRLKKEAEDKVKKEAEKAKQQAKDQLKDKLKFPR
jgi:hypothetical protein